MRKGFTIKVSNSKELSADWFMRQQADQKATLELENNVKEIINQVKTFGDEALVEYSLKFDKAEISSRALRVKPAEIKEAYTKTTPNQISALKFMKEKVSAFQKQQMTEYLFRLFCVQSKVSDVTSQADKQPIQVHWS
jgi:histidinol dehydrogenase